MAVIRKLIYSAMTNSPELTALVGDRVFISTDLDGRPKTPFLVWRVNNSLPENRSLGKATRVAFSVHDEPGDYARIDEVLEIVDKIILGIEPFDSLVCIRWLETSEDFRDPDLETIYKYNRYMVTEATRERILS